ncbi:hypothetical protein KR009_002230, partial [Drosophila setifemur]
RFFFQHYARQNGALFSDTDRPTYNEVPYGSHDSREYCNQPYKLTNLGEDEYGHDRNRLSDTVPTNIDNSFNNSYGYEYLEYYVKDDQRDELESDNWDDSATNAVEYGFEYANQTCTSSKLLPKLPANHISDIPGSRLSKPSTTETEFKMEGMRIKRGQRNGVCMDNTLEDGNAFANNPNGFAGSGYSPKLFNNRVPSSPSRELQPSMRPKLYSHQDLFGLNTDSAITNDLSQRSLNMGPPGSSTNDVLGQMSRPYSSMLPLDYSDYLDCYHSLDSFSTFSDTPPTNHAQLKLQQHRKISLMMAMTTASVIASGETRVPVQSKHSKKTTDNHTDSALDNIINTNTDTKPAARSSKTFFELEACSSGLAPLGDTGDVTNTLITAIATAPKTRKLPKLLPAPQYKSTLPTATTSTIDAFNPLLYSSKPTTEKSLRPKQLPKLPNSLTYAKRHSISMTDSNFTNYPASVALPFSYQISLSQPASITTISTAHTTSLFNEASHKPVVYPHGNIEGNEVVVSESINPHHIPSPRSSPSISLEPNRCPTGESTYDVIDQIPLICMSPECESTKSTKDFRLTLKESLIKSETISEFNKSPEPYSVDPESALFNISEYLKPYTLDAIHLPENEIEIHITNAAGTSSMTQPIYGKEKLSNESFASGDIIAPYLTAWANNEPSQVWTDVRISTSSNTEINDSPLNVEIAPVSNMSYSNNNRKPIVMSESEYLPEALLSASNPNSPNGIGTTLSWSRSSNAFTKTVSANNCAIIPSTTSRDASPSASTLTSPSSTAPMLSYTDYMKQFELPDLPQSIFELPSCVSDKQSDSFAATTMATDSGNSQTFKDFKITNKSVEHVPSTAPQFFQAYTISSYPNGQESPFNDYKEYPSNIIPVVPITTIECSADFKIVSRTTPQEDVILSKGLAFDDTFYDSFNVDLKKLTASVAHIENKPFLSDIRFSNDDNSTLFKNNEANDFFIAKTSDNLDSIDPRDLNKNHSSGPVGYYKPIQTISSATHQSPPTKPSLPEHLIPPKQEKTKTSVLDGLSKGIKGGLDGVLIGVSSTVEVSQQANIKKGFGFNLASKLVPSVGGLLSNSSSNFNKLTLTTKTETTPTYTITTSEPNFNGTGTYMGSNSPPIQHDSKETNLYVVTVSTSLQESPLYNNETISTSSGIIRNSFDNCVERYDEVILSDEIMSVELVAHECEQSFSYYDPEKEKPDVIIGSNSSYTPNELASDVKTLKITQPAAQIKHLRAKKINTTGSMFGSILGKAAAAVQSATQVVNQSASSMASVVTQKPSMPPTTLNMDSTQSTFGFDSINIDYDYQVLNQETQSSHYSNTGDDYENSNVEIHEYDTITDNNVFSYLHSNGNQSLLKENVSINCQSQEIGNGTKKLPTVPPAGSTGKKLPSINGKSGLLIKQMPTEIYDDDSVVDEINVNSPVGKEPRYYIDSGQDDYCLDLQQTTPSNQSNGYYENVNSGYDYREDYFNEEDEYKYLEQQRQQEQQPSSNKQIKHIKTMLLNNQPQSSLDFIDEGQDNDFIFENYHSEEDSGNYLDESSSGSVGPIEGQKSLKMDVTSLENQKGFKGDGPFTSIGNQIDSFNSINISNQLTPSHQPIQKQDSIFDELMLNQENHKHKQTCPEVEDKDEELNDQIGDLADLKKIIPQKKKLFLRGETEEVVSGHMQMIRQSEITARQRWHWAYNKIIMQLNVSTKN